MNKIFLCGLLLLPNLLQAMEVEISPKEIFSGRLSSNGFSLFVEMTNIVAELGGKKLLLSRALNITNDQLLIFNQRVDNSEAAKMISKKRLLFEAIFNDSETLQELKALGKL